MKSGGKGEPLTDDVKKILFDRLIHFTLKAITMKNQNAKI